MRILHRNCLALAGVLLALLACAGCGRQALALSPATQPILSATPRPDLSLDAPLPAGVNPQLWAQLCSALRGALARPGKTAAAAVPAAEASRVSDFVIVPDAAGLPEASWTYTNPGDYNQNGVVGADDLQPLAAYWGLTDQDQSWMAASSADGNGDSLVDIRDVLAIAQNFGRMVGGYVLQQGASPEQTAGWTGVLSVQFASGMPRAVDGRREFRPALPGALPGAYYRVVPYLALEGLPPAFGLPGNVYLYAGGLAGPGLWPMAGGDSRRSGYSSVAGPSQLRLRWQVDSRRMNFASWNQGPVLGRDGAVYLAQAGRGLEAYSPAGALRWSCGAGAYALSCPVVGADGTVYVLGAWSGLDAGASCKLLAIGADGKARWQAALPGQGGQLALDGDSLYVSTTVVNACYSAAGVKRWSRALSNPALDPALIAIGPIGEVYFCNGPELSQHQPDGALNWQVALPGTPTAQPAVRADGVVLLPAQGELCAYSSAGQELWRTTTAGPVKALALAPDETAVIVTGASGAPLSLSVLGSGGELQKQAVLGFSASGVALVLDAAGKVYLNAKESGLHCLTLDGAECWHYFVSTAGCDSRAEALSCAIGADQALYVCDGGYAYCVADDGTSLPVEPVVTASDATFVDRVRVSWNAAPEADGYRLYRDNALLLVQQETQYDDYSLVDTEYHTYTVRAVNELGLGALGPGARGRMQPSGLSNGGAGDWVMYGHDARRTFCSSAVGPEQGQLRWQSTPLTAGSTGYAPVCGAERHAVRHLPCGTAPGADPGRHAVVAV